MQGIFISNLSVYLGTSKTTARILSNGIPLSYLKKAGISWNIIREIVYFIENYATCKIFFHFLERHYVRN